MLSEHTVENFNTLVRAAANGDVALLDAYDVTLGRAQPVIAAATREDSGEVTFVPFALLLDENPYVRLRPPAVGTGQPYEVECAACKDRGFLIVNNSGRLRVARCAVCAMFDSDGVAEQAVLASLADF